MSPPAASFPSAVAKETSPPAATAKVSLPDAVTGVSSPCHHNEQKSVPRHSGQAIPDVAMLKAYPPVAVTCDVPVHGDRQDLPPRRSFPAAPTELLPAPARPRMPPRLKGRLCGHPQRQQASLVAVRTASPTETSGGKGKLPSSKHGKCIKRIFKKT